MKKESLIEILFEEMDRLREAKTDKDINTESQRAIQICNIAERIIDFGNMQIKAFDVLGDKASKDNIKRIGNG